MLPDRPAGPGDVVHGPTLLTEGDIVIDEVPVAGPGTQGRDHPERQQGAREVQGHGREPAGGVAGAGSPGAGVLRVPGVARLLAML